MNGLWRELLVIGVALGGVWMGAECRRHFLC